MSIPRTNETVSKSPIDFVREELVARLGAKKVFVGYDFKFGKNSEGDSSLLSKLGKEYGFTVHVLPEIKISDIPVKSSIIRHFIEDGDFYAANMKEKSSTGKGSAEILVFPPQIFSQKEKRYFRPSVFTPQRQK